MLSTFVLTHSLFLQKKIQTLFLTTLSRGTVLHPTLPMDRVTRRRFRMAQDSDDPLFVVNVVVWILVVIIAIMELHCPLPRRVVR